MNLVVLDHETFYSQDYSLSKISTEAYVQDSQFQSILTSIKINNQAPIYHVGDSDSITQWLFDHDVQNACVVAHNHMFDGLVNQIHHDLEPPIMLCTMYMAKALLSPYLRSVSLDSCLKHLKLGVSKGSYVHQMKGRRRESLSGSELRDYANYCVADVEGTYHLFKWLVKRLPREELDIIDMTLRMYLNPVLEADADTFRHVLHDERKRKAILLSQLPEDVVQADLMSNVKFAKVLQSYGVDVPTKISPTTDKTTWAFARTDPGWKELEADYADDKVVGPLLAARLGAKSTLAETRAERMVEIGERFGLLRIPLIYYSAHTGRYGGTQKINPQNFTRVDRKRTDPGGNIDRRQLRFGIKAPPGKVVLAPDLSQIEARLNAWMCDCTHLVYAFAAGRDVYSEFATQLFNRPITKRDEKERFIGKTGILGLGYGMGAEKLRATLRKDDILVSEDTAKHYVGTYRSLYNEIPTMWRFCDELIDTLVNGGGTRRLGPCMVSKGKIELPNGMYLNYHKLKYLDTKKYAGWTYMFGGRVRTLWGGKIVENVIQALARIVIMDAMRSIKRVIGHRPALQAHDELVYVVMSEAADDLRAEMIRILCIPPDWAPDLPLAAEAENYGPTYGDAK